MTLHLVFDQRNASENFSLYTRLTHYSFELKVEVQLNVKKVRNALRRNSA